MANQEIAHRVPGPTSPTDPTPEVFGPKPGGRLLPPTAYNGEEGTGIYDFQDADYRPTSQQEDDDEEESDEDVWGPAPAVEQP